MNLTGVYCTLLMGPTIPAPLPSHLTEVVHEIEVVHRDGGRSGFKIEFDAGRQGVSGALDYAILQNPQIKPFNRVYILVTFSGSPQLLMDGIITDIRVQNIDRPGSSKIIVMGQDVSIMMDRKQVQAAHPAQSEFMIANKIISQYAKYQLVPTVTPPPLLDIPNPIEWTPRQYDTDYTYLKKLAKRFGYVFYVAPGPTPGTNIAYWGPPRSNTPPQPALKVAMGYGRNVREISFQQNALAATTISGEVQDRISDQVLPVQTLLSTRLPLSQTAITNTNTQQLLLEEEAGLNYSQAQARAQGITDRSRDHVVVAEGLLNTEKYGGILKARGLVGIQGAGLTNDGLYYVEQVIHTLGRGYYNQQFTLTRDGTGSTVPAVIP